MNQNSFLLCLITVLLSLPVVSGCGDDGENRVVTGISPEYQMRADAQAEYEKAMKASKR